MKIALVSPYDYAYPGGVTVHISHLARLFSQEGHRVKIFAPCSNSKALLHPNDIIPLGRSFPIPSGGSIARIAFSPWLLPRLKRILREEDFDIIHVHEPLTPLLPWGVLYLSESVNVGTFHAYHGNPRGYRFARIFFQPIWRRLKGRIAVSEPAKSFIARWFPGSYRIIPNGVDTQHFSPTATTIEQFQDGKQNILFVGRLEKRKGLDYLLGAYEQVKKEFPQSRLLVVGPGTRLRHGYERWIAERNLKDVVFGGYIPYDKLPQFYNTADVVCAPATGKESFGLVLLEAMAVGKPVVATNIEGYANVISPGKEGLLVPPQDTKALAESLLTLLQDESLRQEMGANGRIKAEKYRWEHIATEVLEYYQELLSSS